MADNNQLLNEIRKVVRDEVKAEGEAIRKDMATKTDLEPINKKLDGQGKDIKSLKADINIIKTDVTTVKDVTAHTKTAVETLDAKLDAAEVELRKEIKQGQRPRHAD